MSFKDKLSKILKKNPPLHLEQKKLPLEFSKFNELTRQDKKQPQKIFDHALVNTDKQLTMMDDGKPRRRAATPSPTPLLQAGEGILGWHACIYSFNLL